MTTTTRIDTLVDLTPVTRDRYVDALRAGSIAVVVLWHWVFSITHWNGSGQLTMPNPIGSVSMLWLATWFLQVMPVFFFVGGFSNLTAWSSYQRDGRGDREFLKSRLQRLVAPAAVFAASWAVFDTILGLVDPTYSGVMHWGQVLFVPLWFLCVYIGVVMLVPITARLQRRIAALPLVGMAAGIALIDLARFQWDLEGIAYLNGALVFLFAHQLGYLYADGTLLRWTRSRLWALTLAAGAGLVLLTNIGVYPRSMVAVSGEAVSNMNPPTAAIACLAVFQMGLVMLARPAMSRWLQGRRVWKSVILVNSVAMTVFVWHMTAYALALWVFEVVGGRLGDTPSANWWSQRPLWLVLPGVFLVAIVTIAARFERPGPAKTMA